MGGGKKKQTLSQIERSQGKKPEKKKETKSSGPAEKKAPSVIIPDLKSEKIVEEVRKLRILTPFSVASRFNLRLSVAKDFLDELEKKGAIQLVSRSRNVKVYRSLD